MTLTPYLKNFTMGLLVNHGVTRYLRYRDVWDDNRLVGLRPSFLKKTGLVFNLGQVAGSIRTSSYVPLSLGRGIFRSPNRPMCLTNQDWTPNLFPAQDNSTTHIHKFQQTLGLGCPRLRRWSIPFSKLVHGEINLVYGILICFCTLYARLGKIVESHCQKRLVPWCCFMIGWVLPDSVFVDSSTLLPKVMELELWTLHL